MNINLAPQSSSSPPLQWKAPKMTWWYWALIDMMVEHPELNKIELAAHFRVTPACVYLITNSDMFKAHLAQRQQENASHVDTVIRKKMVDVAAASLDVLKEKIDKKRDILGMEELTSVADKTLQRLGYGIKQAPGVTVNTTGQTQVVVPASLQDLEAARSALRAVERQHRAPEVGHDNTSSHSQLVGQQPESVYEGRILSSTSGGSNGDSGAGRDEGVVDIGRRGGEGGSDYSLRDL